MCVKNTDISTKSFVQLAYSIYCEGGKSVLIVKESLWKSNHKFVKDVNFVVIVIVSRKNVRHCFCTIWHILVYESVENGCIGRI